MKQYDGIVVQVMEKQIVMLCTQDGTFKNIPRSRGHFPLIGEKVTYKEKKSFFHPSHWIKLASIACLLFLIFSMYPSTKSEAAYILAIDINPSIEVYLDKDLKVTQVAALNDDGGKLINPIDYKGKSVSDMVQLIIGQCVTQHYLSSSLQGLVTTTIIPIGGEHKLTQSELQSIIQNSLNQNSVTANVNVSMGSKEIFNTAHQLNLSVNKYVIYEQFKEKGIPVSVETVQSTPIMKLLEQDQRQSNNGQGKDQGNKKDELKNPLNIEPPGKGLQGNPAQNNQVPGNQSQNNQGKDNQGQKNQGNNNSQNQKNQNDNKRS